MLSHHPRNSVWLEKEELNCLGLEEIDALFDICVIDSIMLVGCS